MYFKGEDFIYTFNGENKTKEEFEQLIDYDTTFTVDGLNISYVSPKKSKIQKDHEQYFNNLCGIAELLKEVDKHQEQNGGILKGMEFPFDAVLTPTREEREQEVIKAWEREDVQQYIEDWFKQPINGTIGTLDDIKNKEVQEKGSLGFNFQKSQIGAKKEIGQKHNKHKAPLDILQTKQFPKALQLLALATAYGNFKYKTTDLDFLNFKRVEGGSQTYLDASARHSTNRNRSDIESGLYHIIHAVWNQLASLEIWVEENELNIEEYSKNFFKSLEIRK